MRKVGIAALALAAASAALAAAASSHAPAVEVPHVAAKPAKGEGALLAVVPGARGPVLGRADKRAVWIARRSPRLRIFNPVAAWAYSPDRTRLALVTQAQQGVDDPAATLQVVEPATLTRSTRLQVGNGYVAGIAVGSSRTTVALERSCCPSSIEIVGVDSARRRVVARQRLDASVVAVARSGSALVLLTAPPAGIGTAEIVVAAEDGSVRSRALDGITAGLSLNGEESFDPAKMRQERPGLAVDAANDVAYVVPGSGSVARIDLASLAVSYHAPAEPVSLLARLHDWVEPQAAAKGLNGPVRTATYLGAGLLAVTGGDETASLDPNNKLRVTWMPSGLRFVDTTTWRTRLVDPGADAVDVDGGLLLATGSRWGSDEAQTGMGLAVYGFDGVRRVSALRGAAAFVELSFRGHAYLSVPDSRARKVVNLATGAVAERRAPVAQLLMGAASD